MRCTVLALAVASALFTCLGRPLASAQGGSSPCIVNSVQSRTQILAAEATRASNGRVAPFDGVACNALATALAQGSNQFQVTLPGSLESAPPGRPSAFSTPRAPTSCRRCTSISMTRTAALKARRSASPSETQASSSPRLRSGSKTVRRAVRQTRWRRRLPRS
jgi:hypothetical protein